MNTILEVLGYMELHDAPIDEREVQVRQLLETSNALLYVDNLETVDDPKVIAFLDDLPLGVRGLVTSRRATVRVAVRPVDVGPLSLREARALVLYSPPNPALATSQTSPRLRSIGSRKRVTAYHLRFDGRSSVPVARPRRYTVQTAFGRRLNGTRGSCSSSSSVGCSTPCHLSSER